MAYSSAGFTDTQDNQKKFNEQFVDSDPGPYIGTVKVTNDPLKMGRLGVNIPALTRTNDPAPGNIIWCQYLSPFYGAKSINAVSEVDPYLYKETQHSYGMWAVPPDVDTDVLVIFAKGEQKASTAFWIGCVQKPLVNQQVPGHGATENTSIAAEGPITQLSKQQLYGTDFLPAGEKNQRMYADGELLENADKWKYPINDVLADQLMTQGLIGDKIKGTTSSSARRESPSRVFGINTPGRIKTDSRELDIGLDNTKVRTDRDPGHSFVMDDGAVDGTNQLTRLRTASGHQLLMHDTAGVVYIANGSGDAYIEMNRDGRIHLYSGIGGIAMRTHGDFNLHADLNINMHANGQIRMSSAKEMIQSADAVVTLGENGILQSSQSGGIQSYAKSAISSHTPGSQLHGASGVFHVQGSQVHLNAPMGRPGSGGGGITQWGPSWLTKEKAGMQLRDEGDVKLDVKGFKPLKPFTAETKTTVHKLVTHEPMPNLQPITGDGIIPNTKADKDKWLQRARTPGTSEYLSHQLRLSADENLRRAQAQADKLAFLQKTMGNSTNGEKAKKLLNDFTLNYNDFYGISEMANLPFDIKDSISEQFKGLDVNSDLKKISNNLTSQVIENFTGKSTDLFKDNVFVNSSGQLFTLGQGIGGGFDLANSGLNAVKGLKGNLSAGNIPATISNLSSITQNYKSVIGGKITGINQIQGLATKAGLFNASAAQLSGQSFLQNVGQNIGLKLGSLGSSIKSVFSGKFSDSRLKEEIKLVGKSPSGINIYSFKYKHTDGTYEGVMAQEVPWAREMTDTGYYAVDYGKVDVEFRRVH